MLAISAFGSHQPLVVCTHISHKSESDEVKSKQNLISQGRKDTVNGKEGGVTMGQESMILHLNWRIKEVTKTLNKSTVSGPGVTKARKK